MSLVRDIEAAPGSAGPRRANGTAYGMVAATVAIMAAALAIRLYGLDASSLWLDEAYSVWFSSQGWSYLWTEVPRFETHPSLYYSLLKLWRVFGSDEYSLRLLSVLINVATIPFVALLARHCGNRDTGRVAAVLAAILFACSPTQVQAAQDARAYALMTLGLAIALASAVAVMTAGPRAEAPLRRMIVRDRGLALAFAGIGIGIALLGWSHNIGPVFGMMLGACLFGFWLAQGAPRRLLANLLVSVAVAALLYGPNMPIALMQAQALSSNGFWARPPDLAVGIETILHMPLGYSDLVRPRILAGGIATLVLVLAGLAAMARPGRGVPRAVPVTLAVMAFGPILLLFVLSHVRQPVFVFRVLQPTQVPMLAALAFAPLALARLLPARARWAGFALVVFLGMMALWHAQPGRKLVWAEDWRGFTRTIAAASAPAVPKLVIYPPEAELPFLYYGPRLGIPLEIMTVPAHFPARRADYTYPAGNGGSPGMTPEMAADAIARLKGDNRVWIVSRVPEIYDPQGLFMAGMEREFPCLIDDSMPRIQLRGRAAADGGCPDG